MFETFIEKVTEKQAFLDFFGAYTFGILKNVADGELRYRKKTLTSRICRSKFDVSLHKLHHSKTTFLEKVKIRYQILNLVMNKNFKKLKESRGLLSKYCLLFPDHNSLLDDWLKMWNISYIFFRNEEPSNTCVTNLNISQEYTDQH